MPTATTHTVESFNLCLEPFDAVLQAEKPIHHVERQIMEQLPHASRLLRWAIVKIEGKAEGHKIEQRYWCEGAYLKTLT